MLEETPPPYSYPDHLYVPNRTHVWHSPCRRSLCPSVAFRQRRKIPWGTSLCSEMKPIQRGRPWRIHTFHKNRSTLGETSSDVRIASRMAISSRCSVLIPEKDTCATAVDMWFSLKPPNLNVFAINARGSRSLNDVS
jgi:hypothetical protein